MTKNNYELTLYGLLIRLYPKHFYNEYHELLEQSFRDILRDRKQQKSSPVSFWLHIIKDLILSFYTEYTEEYKNMNNNKKILVIGSTVLLLTHLGIFSAGYFFNKIIDFKYILLIYISMSVLVWSKYQTTQIRKIIYIVLTCIGSTVLGTILIVATMRVPGSKEHNYVMYELCLPAIDTYYQRKGTSRMTEGMHQNKDGINKWWYQHLECEQNVWAGKGPVFADNPPGFEPK